MKISDGITDKIIIKAQVCSEWDSCNCVVVDIDDKLLKEWKSYDEMATKIVSEPSFHCICIWFWGTDYLQISDDEEDIEIPEQEWRYIEVNSAELEKYKPEQQVDANQIKFYGNGNICFIGYGKHTSEEFWSETVNINELIEQV